MRFYFTKDEIENMSVEDLMTKTLYRNDLLIEREVGTHDCKLSEDDGCQICEDIHDLTQEEALLKDKGMCVDRLGNCEEDKCNCWNDAKA